MVCGCAAGAHSGEPPAAAYAGGFAIARQTLKSRSFGHNIQYPAANSVKKFSKTPLQNAGICDIIYLTLV